MSKVTALNGAKFKGIINIHDAGLLGMISLRGDLSDSKLLKAVKVVCGCDMPDIRAVVQGDTGRAAWMSPDELLLILPYNQLDASLNKLETALEGGHFLAVDVSDARQMFELSGAFIREVLAKGSPADLSPDVLGLNEMRRTRLGQLPVAFWLTSDDKAHLICFRSVAGFVFDWLCNSADKTGRISYF